MVQGGINAGTISKPYGLQGEVHMILNPLIAQTIKEGIPLFIELDGQRVPFFTETVEILSGDQAIIKLEFINNVGEARKVCGCRVFLDPAITQDILADPDDPVRVVGYRAIDKNLGLLGMIRDYIPGTLNPVWIIEYEGREIMVPAAGEFIINIDHESGSLYLNLPGGITEL
jgi:16S rRNA processing protein RimM